VGMTRNASPLPPPRRRSWRRLAGIAFVGALALGLQVGCSTLDERQRSWIFQPGDRTWSGGLAAAQGMDDVWIDFRSQLGESPAAAVRLHGLWLPQPDPNAPVLLYLHGARYDVRGSAPRMRRMHELGFAVLGVDYRGFGRSTAALPSEAMAAEDAQAAWAWLAQQHPHQRRFIFGHSLGGAIAVELASQVSDEAGVIVEGSFTSIPDVVSSFRWGWLPVSPLITQRFDAASRVADVGSPLLVVHGSRDSLIPARLGQGLFERARQPKRFVLVEGGSHHNTNAVGQAQYRQALGELFGM
jgi:alpha-beta hydrolase superfamily lysophospholipase